MSRKRQKKERDRVRTTCTLKVALTEAVKAVIFYSYDYDRVRTTCTLNASPEKLRSKRGERKKDTGLILTDFPLAREAETAELEQGQLKILQEREEKEVIHRGRERAREREKPRAAPQTPPPPSNALLLHTAAPVVSAPAPAL
jgi:hypothetical protein